MHTSTCAAFFLFLLINIFMPKWLLLYMPLFKLLVCFKLECISVCNYYKHANVNRALSTLRHINNDSFLVQFPTGVLLRKLRSVVTYQSTVSLVAITFDYTALALRQGAAVKFAWGIFHFIFQWHQKHFEMITILLINGQCNQAFMTFIYYLYNTRIFILGVSESQ